MGAPVVHFEVIGKDPDKLREFYGELFDWGFSDPIGPTNYRMIERNTNDDGVGIAGGIGGVPEGYDGHVTFYVEVDDVGQALDKVEKLGGTKMMGPDQVPEGPVIGLFTDPMGHTVGLVGGGEAQQRDEGESSSGERDQESGGQESSSESSQSSEGSQSSSESSQSSSESSSSEGSESSSSEGSESSSSEGSESSGQQSGEGE